MPAGPRQGFTLTEYIDMMDAKAARTQKFCTDQPAQQQVRTALLRAEKELHQAGWDGPPKVFYLQENIRNGRIRYTEFEKFSQMLLKVPGGTPVALDKLAYVAESVRHQAQVPAAELDPGVHTLPTAFRDMMFRMRASPHDDLVGVTYGNWRFHGVGVAHEAWMVLNPDESTVELAGRRRLYTHPERMEIREVYYASRDGWSWEVKRMRRTPTIAVPRHCIVLHRDNDFHLVGSIPNALTRMCNAIASNPVPIVSDTWLPGE